MWRAHDIDLDREAAVKELRAPEQVTEEERRVRYARMERKARAAARLSHPGIVTVHDRRGAVLPEHRHRPVRHGRLVRSPRWCSGSPSKPSYG